MRYRPRTPLGEEIRTDDTRALTRDRWTAFIDCVIAEMEKHGLPRSALVHESFEDRVIEIAGANNRQTLWLRWAMTEEDLANCARDVVARAAAQRRASA
jgi:hypothetical protein